MQLSDGHHCHQVRLHCHQVRPFLKHSLPSNEADLDAVKVRPSLPSSETVLDAVEKWHSLTSSETVLDAVEIMPYQVRWFLVQLRYSLHCNQVRQFLM